MIIEIIIFTYTIILCKIFINIRLLKWHKLISQINDTGTDKIAVYLLFRLNRAISL